MRLTLKQKQAFIIAIRADWYYIAPRPGRIIDIWV